MSNIVGFRGRCGDIHLTVDFGFEVDSNIDISCAITDIGLDVALDDRPTSVYSVDYEIRVDGSVRRVDLSVVLYFLKNAYPALEQYKVAITNKTQQLGAI